MYFLGIGKAAQVGVKTSIAFGENIAAKLAANGGFARIGNSLANKQVTDVARQLGMKGTQVKEFSRYVHEIKGMVGKGGADNFKSYQSIKTLGEEFLGLYGK